MADTLVICDSGIARALNVWTNAAPSQHLAGSLLRLFNNNHTVTKATLLGDLTQATYPGYAAIALPALPASSVSAHVATSAPAAAVTFLCTGGGPTESEYGGYITDSTGALLLAAWNFGAGPFVMFTNGDTIDVTPTFSTQSLNG